VDLFAIVIERSGIIQQLSFCDASELITGFLA